VQQQQEIMQQQEVQQQQEEEQQQGSHQEALPPPEGEGLQAGASFAGELLKWPTCCARVHAGLSVVCSLWRLCCCLL
jgi:hypothetical protein